MLSDISPSDALEFLIVLVGILLLLKRVAGMEKYHRVRVVALTVVLSWFAVMFFLGYALQFGNSGLTNCTIDFEVPPR